MNNPPMHETASVLFMDIVKFSLQPIATQKELLEILQRVVQASNEFQKADGAGELLRLATGDGMALVFRRDFCAPVRCAIELATGLKMHPQVRLRMGVNAGPISWHTDVNEKDNVVGEGINIAQRVMDLGDAGHILVAHSVAEMLRGESDWNAALVDLGLVEVKHEVLVHIYNVCKQGLGNPARPSKLVQAVVREPSRSSLPARPPIFVGREAEIAELRARLSESAVVPVQGTPGLGKTTLALEFVHRYKADFEAVYWLQCVERDLAALAGELMFQLGVRIEGDLEKILHDLRAECASKRCLLVLDNVEDGAPGALIPGGRASVLVTTRIEAVDFLAYLDRVKPALFTDDECLAVFRRVVGDEEVKKSESSARSLFKELGYLPVGVAVAAGLIKHDTRYTIDSLSKKLPELEKLKFGKNNVGALLREAIAATGEDERKLMPAMAVCAPEGFRLGLAAEIAGLGEEAALDALQELKSRSLVEELDREERRYRLHALVRAAADSSDALRLRHATAVNSLFKDWEKNWRACEKDLPDLRQAFTWSVEGGADLERWSLGGELAFQGYSLTLRIGRLLEAMEFCERCSQAAEAKGDKQALQAWYGNQALILRRWGRLEEALALHKKEEAICEELGIRDGLQACYGNQALILQAWGRLEEALALHKKQEAICEELGNRDGLQRSYGNQALILKDWGRLEEALALHKKEEAICEELGNRQSLATCYANMASLAHERGDVDEARSRAEAALAIFAEMKMPRETEAVKKLLERIGGG